MPWHRKLLLTATFYSVFKWRQRDQRRTITVVSTRNSVIGGERHEYNQRSFRKAMKFVKNICFYNYNSIGKMNIFHVKFIVNTNSCRNYIVGFTLKVLFTAIHHNERAFVLHVQSAIVGGQLRIYRNSPAFESTQIDARALPLMPMLFHLYAFLFYIV